MFGLPTITVAMVFGAVGISLLVLIWWGFHFRGEEPDE